MNLLLMGIFFVVPLYLQIVLGLDALETGIKMLPTSIADVRHLGARVAVQPALPGAHHHPGRPRHLARWRSSLMISAIDPALEGVAFGLSMALLGVGMGLLASQLGNLVQSSVDASGRSEAGGLQYTAQQLGSSLGVALIGAIVIAGLVNSFVANVEDDPRIGDEVAQQVGIAVDGSVDFVTSEQVAAAATVGRPGRGHDRMPSCRTTRTPSCRR